MLEKRGQSSTIGVTIAIVLGVLLIVFLIWGFSTNWSMFSSTSSAYSGKTNIDVVKRACQLHCENDRPTEFCEVTRTVIDENGKSSEKSCQELYPSCTLPCPAKVVESCVPNGNKGAGIDDSEWAKVVSACKARSEDKCVSDGGVSISKTDDTSVSISCVLK